MALPSPQVGSVSLPVMRRRGAEVRVVPGGSLSGPSWRLALTLSSLASIVGEALSKRRSAAGLKRWFVQNVLAGASDQREKRKYGKV